jgi:hypothetical protein
MYSDDEIKEEHRSVRIVVEYNVVGMSHPSTLEGTCFTRVFSSKMDEFTLTPQIPSLHTLLTPFLASWYV